MDTYDRYCIDSDYLMNLIFADPVSNLCSNFSLSASCADSTDTLTNEMHAKLQNFQLHGNTVSAEM